MSNNCSYSHIRHDADEYDPITNQTHSFNTNQLIYIDKANNTSQDHQNIQIYQFNDDINQDQSEQQVLLIMDEEEHINASSSQALLQFDQNNNIYDQTQNKMNKKFNSITNSTIVPALSNVDEIFQMLSQKIAKYCQVLADLTNCEVFYKAQLPLNNSTETLQTQTQNQTEKPVKTSKYKPKSTHKHTRSLYWGTHQMLFQYSHNHGLKYDKSMGDSLIKINQRSLSSDVNSLIEEILNEPNVNLNKGSKSLRQSPVVEHSVKKSDDKKVDLKDCFIYLDRLDDSIFDQYLNKFEMTNNQINSSLNKHEFEDDLNLPSEQELYSDETKINFSKFLSKNDRSSSNKCNIDEMNEDEEIEEDDDEDLDEKALLVKNCFGLNENEEDYYSCEYCHSHSFKHLTQLKLHQLRVHEQIPIEKENTDDFECAKCKQNIFENRIDYLKHLLLCFYPDIYSCKTCNQPFHNYSQYLFHTKYVHTHVVYMCAICGRKYRQIKDLLDHDQLIHSKSLNYCEICFEQQKSKKSLNEHYKNAHLNEYPLYINESLDQPDSILNEPSTIALKQAQLETSAEQLETDLPTSLTVPSSSSVEFVLTDDLNIEKTTPDDNPQLYSDPCIERNKNLHKNDLIRGLIDRKHQCKWCSLRFYTKSQLKQHETTHMNSVLFCPVCDKEFTHKDRLSGHMKCHMEPSLECKVCGKKFKRLCNLYNHELVHGLTEHAFMLCQFCGRGFRSRRDYQNHVIANHRDQLMKSDSINQMANINHQQAELSIPKESTPVKKTPKRLTKSQSKKSANTSTYPVKTTTVVLTDDLTDTSNHLSLNEPDTYFTRTGTVQLNRDMDEDEDETGLNDDENQDYINELVNNIESHSFNLDLNGSVSGSKSKRGSYKPRNSIKNKIKRLKRSLNIEVLDDNDDGDDDNNNNSNSSNLVVNFGQGSGQVGYGSDLSDFNGIMHSNVHLVHLNDNLV